MPVAVLASSNFTDPEHERLIWLAAGGLVLLGALLLVATIIWWRSTKGEHAALAPLEVMGDRSFTTLTPVEQDRRLEAVRLHLEGDVEPTGAPAPEPIDLDEALRTFEPGFDDLRDEAPAVADEAEAPKPPRIAVELVSAAGVTVPEAGDEPADAQVDEPAEVQVVDTDEVEEIDAASVVDDELAVESAEPAEDPEPTETSERKADGIDADAAEPDDEALRTGEPADR